MRKNSVSVAVLAVVGVWVCFLLAVACTAQDRPGATIPAPQGAAAYEVPQGKAQQWEAVQKMAQDEYKVCAEHCAGNTDCLGRCDKAYKTRLDREHQNLMQQ